MTIFALTAPLTIKTYQINIEPLRLGREWSVPRLYFGFIGATVGIPGYLKDTQNTVGFTCFIAYLLLLTVSQSGTEYRKNQVACQAGCSPSSSKKQKGGWL